MNEILNYIDDYFQHKLDAKEKQLFEERCVQDESFAEEVAFYITSRSAARQKILEQKKAAWQEMAPQKSNTTSTIAPVKKIGYLKWIGYVAAASIIIFLGTYFLYSPVTSESLAHAYVEQELSQLSNTMDGSTDSLEKGIGSYKERRYDAALQMFERVYAAHPDNSDALKYTGLAYLMKKEYNRALVCFEELAGKKNLYSNPGVFLKATTLLERGGKDDKEIAEKLLQEVVEKKLENSKEAAAWLNKW